MEEKMKIGSNKKYLSSKNLKGGEIITIKDEGIIEDSNRFKYPDGNPMKNYVFTVELDGQDISMNINKTSRVQLSAAFGDESKEWVGKKATILKEMDRKSGKYCLYLDPIIETDDTEVTPF